MSNRFSEYSDNDIFNEYHRVDDDIDECESAQFYEWEDDAYEMNQQYISQLCDEKEALRQEVWRRGISLAWNLPE